MSADTVRIRDMEWEDMRRMLRVIGPEIGRLAKRGDRFARRVYERYVYAAEHPNDRKANRELRIAFEDYMLRDLTIAERAELMSRFGHQLKESPVGPRIIVPASVSRH